MAARYLLLVRVAPMDADPKPLHPMDLRLPSPLQEIQDRRLAGTGVRLLLKRDDLISHELPGNKWRKLKYNVGAAIEKQQHTLLTFGGAYSNHIRATAAAGRYFGLTTIGIIRGEEHLPLNPVLAGAVRHGMTLTYLDRTRYRDRANPSIISQLHARFGDFYLIPEGGANGYAVQGCAELPPEIQQDFDVLCCSSGTGATLAGIATALRPGQRAIGFAALRNGDFLNADVGRLQREYGRVTDNWSMETEFHFGGFARRNPNLDQFIDDFRARHEVTLDGVYEAKMMYGIFTLLHRGAFDRGTTVVAVLA
jgi:1-aminocyclopropane-1-carboxylate deaminase/D-cysteine desulfhydrase-like pyridoxal-dependent ACC family enzyme